MSRSFCGTFLLRGAQPRGDGPSARVQLRRCSMQIMSFPEVYSMAQTPITCHAFNVDRSRTFLPLPRRATHRWRMVLLGDRGRTQPER